MGLDIHSAQFLLNQKRRGVLFGRVLTLGRQAVYMPASRYLSHLNELGIDHRQPEYADDFFRGLGAASLDFMDASNYEGANVVHDLNQPIEAHLAESYDCVFDGGALEHVFNFPTALKNCMQMVKPGGHLIIITTWNNYAGHGFYQFSPELFYSALSIENGYVVEQMLVVQRNRWYSVANPREVGSRIELINSEPTLLFLTAKRVANKPIFAAWPQQSDYSAIWSPSKSPQNQPPSGAGLKGSLLKKSAALQALQKHWRARKHRKFSSVSNRQNFQPVELGDFSTSVPKRQFSLGAPTGK